MTESGSSKFHVGSILCGGFQGTSVTPQAYHLIVEHHVSTIFLSKKNAVSVKQMTKLIRDLQHIAYTQAKYTYPLMFAIDEEGGMMNLLFDAEYISQFPGAMALAATGDVELVYEVLKALAMELKYIGFSIILGPVLDVVTKLSHQLVGVRSFGTTVEDVVKYGRACAQGLQDGGLFTFGKHFPGIGNATVDSLMELPMMSDSLDQVKQVNSVPFGKLIDEGLLDGISAAGCGVPSISPDETHACLSPVIINQLLRDNMKFNGVVISECLEMDALYHSIGLGQGVILSICAGCDLVMVCHDKASQDEAVESMEKALANGNLDEELILKCMSRIEVLQKRLPSWEEIFPSDRDRDLDNGSLPLFRNKFPELWHKHQNLSQLAYRTSITLVRDYSDILPLTNLVDHSSSSAPSISDKKTNNILILTPLLAPIYTTEKASDSSSQIYPGEEVFQNFGAYLSNHPNNLKLKEPFNILHTTYTANGLTSLHESLIENSQAVIVLTSEASRNMYQIGIVKYVSVLCGANPSSFSNSSSVSHSLLSKPLVIVATQSPYDFFYNRSMGSAYLCCYDYTSNVLKELAGILWGETKAEGCIPGEEKFIRKPRKRRSIDFQSHPERSIAKYRKSTQPKRRWLVDELDLNRDWNSLVNTWKSNADDANSIPISEDPLTKINLQKDSFYKKLYYLLSTTAKSQKHFVVRNSSLNVIYGFVLTWVNDNEDISLSGDLTKEEFDGSSQDKTGAVMYLLVDKARRFQSIGKNLHARAIRYLVKEKGCSNITLGCTFPLLILPGDSSLIATRNEKLSMFLSSVGWYMKSGSFNKNHLMVLDNLLNWQVPKKIFRELMIVGVRFDVCSNPDKLLKLIYSNVNEAEKDERAKESKSDKNKGGDTKQLYMEAIKCLQYNSIHGVKIITALEPSNQNVIGSIILFTNRSQLSKFFPFLEEALKHDSSEPVEIGPNNQMLGCLIGPVIDPSYSNLTEIINFGLVCSGITYLKSNFCDESRKYMQKCVMIGVNDDSSGTVTGMKEIGFQPWKQFFDLHSATKDQLSLLIGDHYNHG